MAKFFGIGPASKSSQPARPFFERVQDWIFDMDVGQGTSLFHVGMFALLVLFVILLYTGTQFFGLRDQAAMEMGQVARNLARGNGYSTQFIRPLALTHLQRVGKSPLDGERGVQPELFTPPGYPLALAAVFKVVTPDFDIGTGRTVKADRLMMVIGWFFFLTTLLLLYGLAREMFDHRAAVLTAFLYVFCEPILDNAVAGSHLNLLMLLFLLAAYGVIKAEKWTAAGRSRWWTGSALTVSALAIGWGTLTDYAFAAVILPLLIYLVVSFPKQWGRRVALCAGVIALVILPWIARNMAVSRTVFGLSRYQLMEEMGVGTDSEIQAGDLQRRYAAAPPKFRLRSLLRKCVVNAEILYQRTLKEVGGGYLIAFFLVSLLHRWRSEAVFRLRRFVFWSLLFTLGWLMVTGPPERNLLIVFMPLMIIYAGSFFYVLFERLQFRTRLLRYGTVGLFVALNAVPLVYKILPPTTTAPYPPYDGGLGREVGGLFGANEMLASDIPWALAWYGDRATVWLPQTDEEFLAINDGVRRISGVYFTQRTLDQLQARRLVEAMVSGERLPWLETFPMQMPPATFPLKSIQVLTPDRQQFLISNLRPPAP